MEHRCSHKDEGPLHHTATPYLYRQPYFFFLGWGLCCLSASERFFRQEPSSLRERGSFLTYGPCRGPARLSVTHNYLLSLGYLYHTMLACGRQYLLELMSKFEFGPLHNCNPIVQDNCVDSAIRIPKLTPEEASCIHPPLLFGSWH